MPASSVNAARGNGRGHRRREDRPVLPVVPVDPNAPHSLVVKAQNRQACTDMLKAEIQRATDKLLKGQKTT